jgi:hypothetical protein
MLTVGYHTLEDRNNFDQIEERGPQKCTRNNAWLGSGYYFWDRDIDMAHHWGKQSYPNGYVVFEGEIKIDENTYDLLGNTMHKNEFKQVLAELKKSNHHKNPEKITVGVIIEYLKRNAGFLYNSIRAASETNNPIIVDFGGTRGEVMRLNDRVQICLITKINLSLHTFRAIYPEEYKTE